MSLFSVPEPLRIRTGPLASNGSWGNNGYFHITLSGVDTPFLVESIWDWGGEQLAVSHPDHRPSWEELGYIKDMFWHEVCVVFQMFQPAKYRGWWSVEAHTAHLFRQDGHRYGAFDITGPDKSMRFPDGAFSDWPLPSDPKPMDCEGYKAWKK